MNIYGYAREVFKGISLNEQIKSLKEYGVKQENIFLELPFENFKEREGLEKLLSNLKKGDKVVTSKMSVIAKSTSHMILLMQKFKMNNISFVSLLEKDIDTSSNNAKLIYIVFALLSNLKESLRVEKKVTNYKNRINGVERKRGLSEISKKKAKIAEYHYRDKASNLSIKDIMNLIGVRSDTTLYKYLKYRGRRNCNICKALFWDVNQNPQSAFCKKHYDYHQDYINKR